jgi:endonuclease III
MPQETKVAKAQRAVAVLAALDHAMPEATIELDYQTPLQLLMAVLLSAQTTDKRVNVVSPALFARFSSAAALAEVTPETIQPYIQTVGLFRNKAKALVALGKALVEKYRGEVPLSRAELAELPGVGAKTAGVVSMHLGGDTAFPVDTHVFRLAHRLGFAKADTPDDVESELRALVPEPQWFKGHQLLVWHGRRVCHAKKAPECHRCVVAMNCPKRGVERQKG